MRILAFCQEADDFDLTTYPARLIDDTYRCLLQRNVKACKILHAALPLIDARGCSHMTTFIINSKRSTSQQSFMSRSGLQPNILSAGIPRQTKGAEG